jgi:hypothetical protein
MDPQTIMAMLMGVQGGPPGMPQGGMPMAPEAPDTGMELPQGPGMQGPPPPQFASTDPSVIQQILAQLTGVRQADHQQLAQEQDSVLQSIMQAMGIGGVNPNSGFSEGAMAPQMMPEQIPGQTGPPMMQPPAPQGY